MNMLKEFWNEEDGVQTVEIVLILAVLVAIALIFRERIMEFINEAMDNIFGGLVDKTSH